MIGSRCLESCPCATADIVPKVPTLNGFTGEQVDVHDTTNTTMTVLNAKLDLTVEVPAATGVPTSDRQASITLLHHDCRR